MKKNHLIGLDRAAPKLQSSFSKYAKLLANFSTTSLCFLQSANLANSHGDLILWFWFLSTLTFSVPFGHVLDRFSIPFVPCSRRPIVSRILTFCCFFFFFPGYWCYWCSLARTASILVTGQLCSLILFVSV